MTTPAPAASKPKRGRRSFVNVFVLALAAGIPLAFEAVPLFDPAHQAAVILVIIACGIALIIWQVVRGRRDADAIATTDDEINDLRIAVKESFLPVAAMLAEMPNLTPAARKQHVKRVADKAAAVLALFLLRHVPRVRANVYVLNRDRNELHPLGWGGVGDAPNPYRVGGVATAENVAWVLAGGPPRHVTAVRTTSPAQGGRADAPYDSYISVVIRSGPYSYGMLSVDSEEENPFTDTDIQTVKAMAELMAVGLAMAYQGESGSPPA